MLYFVGDLEFVVDYFSVVFVCGFDGGEYVEVVVLWVDGFGGVDGGEKGVENVVGVGEGVVCVYFEVGEVLVMG